MVQRYEQMRRLQWYKRGAAYKLFCAGNKLWRKGIELYDEDIKNMRDIYATRKFDEKRGALLTKRRKKWDWELFKEKRKEVSRYSLR